MWRIIKQGLRTGVVTSSIQAVEAAAPPGTRGRPELDAALCTGCAACAQACPSGAIALGAPAELGRRGGPAQRSWQLDYGACIFCGLCAEACTPRALRMTGDYALSTLRREDLVLVTTVAARHMLPEDVQ